MKIEKPKYVFVRIDICRNCQGTGFAKDDKDNVTTYTCAVCNGKGRVRITKTVNVTIETLEYDII